MSKHYLWQKEFEDYLAVLDMGAIKYSPNGWLEPNGKRTSFKEYHDSMFHHLAKSFSGQRLDDESGLDHLLHIITNAQMLYTRLKRGVVNDLDVAKPKSSEITQLFMCSSEIRANLKPLEKRSTPSEYDDEEE